MGDKLFTRRQSSCMALTAPLSHKWYLKSRKQMRAKAPFKVHLRCLKSIYTHILLRSLLYELLMKSTFCYPTLLMHRGKKKQTRKPTQAVGKQMHHRVLYQHGLGGFGSSRAARYICKEEEGNEKKKKSMSGRPPPVSHRSHVWDCTPMLLISAPHLSTSSSFLAAPSIPDLRADGELQAPDTEEPDGKAWTNPPHLKPDCIFQVANFLRNPMHSGLEHQAF